MYTHEEYSIKHLNKVEKREVNFEVLWSKIYAYVDNLNDWIN